MTPSEFFVQSLQVKEDTGVNISTVCPGARIQVLLNLYVEVSFVSIHCRIVLLIKAR